MSPSRPSRASPISYSNSSERTNEPQTTVPERWSTLEKRNSRNGLTVVIILVIFAGCVARLICISPTRRVTRRRTTQKFDFQAIDAALSRPITTDFGDYPRNSLLPKWNTMQLGLRTPRRPRRRFIRLATGALPGRGRR